jgi:hypothetical protein
MKILLDECVPAPIQRLLSTHVCITVQAKGWAGIKNGDLLRRAEVEFDLFITSDQNIRYQQTSLVAVSLFSNCQRIISDAFKLPLCCYKRRCRKFR